jgi:hypothetical protein
VIRRRLSFPFYEHEQRRPVETVTVIWIGATLSRSRIEHNRAGLGLLYADRWRLTADESWSGLPTSAVCHEPRFARVKEFDGSPKADVTLGGDGIVTYSCTAASFNLRSK